MERSEENGALAIFTALSPLAVGGLIGLLIIPHDPASAAMNWAVAIVFITGLIALLISLLHLARPWRAPMALRRVTKSWLSREVILYGLFVIFLGGYLFLPLMVKNNPTLSLIGYAGAVLGFGATIATGETYHLRARPFWDQWLSVASFPLGALSSGCLFGFFLLGRFTFEVTDWSIGWIFAAIMLIFSLIASILRSIPGRSTTAERRASRDLALGSQRWLLVTRVLMVIIAFSFILVGGILRPFAWLPALIGELADRFLFFRSVIPVTLRGRYLQKTQ